MEKKIGNIYAIVTTEGKVVIEEKVTSTGIKEKVRQLMKEGGVWADTNNDGVGEFFPMAMIKKIAFEEV